MIPPAQAPSESRHYWKFKRTLLRRPSFMTNRWNLKYDITTVMRSIEIYMQPVLIWFKNHQTCHKQKMTTDGREGQIVPLSLQCMVWWKLEGAGEIRQMKVSSTDSGYRQSHNIYCPYKLQCKADDLLVVEVVESGLGPRAYVVNCKA